VPGGEPKQKDQVSIRDIANRAEPSVLNSTGAESLRNGTSKLTDNEIDRIVKATRVQKKKC
jgi:hypothetical protein